MVDNTNNKNYWNEYVAYWENKVQEANSDSTNIVDKTIGDDNLSRYVEKLKISRGEFCLDFGCGSCRLYSNFVKNYPLSKYVGVDIALECLLHAEKKWEGQLKISSNLWEFDGSQLPFSNDYFDKIICFGVFDACKQEDILKELLRVLKIGGVLLLTGKNNDYCIDDDEAYIAEINARKKGHPNSFTNVKNLIGQLKEQNYNILEHYYFNRRGDFTENIFRIEMPERFYEWVLLIQKSAKSISRGFDTFSDHYSETFKKRDLGSAANQLNKR